MYFIWMIRTGALLEKILWGVSGLQLPSKEFELKLYKPKLFKTIFQIMYDEQLASLEGRDRSNAKIC